VDHEDLKLQISEHADGRPASAELQQALRDRPELRAELELARKHAARLQLSLEAVKPSQHDYAEQQAQIMAQLPASLWSPRRVALLAAASIALLLAGLAIYTLSTPGEPGHGNAAVAALPAPPAPLARVWFVERYSPAASESPGVAVQLDQRLVSGRSLSLGQQEYARVREAETGTTWLAYPGTQLAAQETLQLQQGAIELESTPVGSAEVTAAGRTYRSQSNFSVSVDGPATLVCVYTGTVTQTVASTTQTLGPGNHELGGSIPSSRTQAWSAYVKGFEAWRSKDYAAAQALFKQSAESTTLDDASRRYAHFYWFAAAGAGDKAQAVVIGQSYVDRYPSDATVPYVRFFLGSYLLALNRPSEAQPQLRVVVATGTAQLKELAQQLLDRQDGAKATRAQTLWEAFYLDWQRQDYAACEKHMRDLLRDCPQDASVTGGEAHFRLFASVGNQGRLEDAIALAENVLQSPAKARCGDYVLYFKANYQSQLGRTELALQSLAQLEKDHPESPMRELAQALRDSLQAHK